jgi:predicted hydrocarbon binding protein
MTRRFRKEGLTASTYEKFEMDQLQDMARRLGTEWILLRVEAFQGMKREVGRALGTGAYVVCYLAGKGAGKSMAKLIQERIKSNSLKEVCMGIAEIYEGCGWGRLRLIIPRQNLGEFRIRIYENAFVKGINSRASSCHFIKGFLEGILEHLVQNRVKSEETRCMAKGDSYCEFVLRLR